MKTITKFIYFGFASLALACGSIASAQVPVTPADSAAKAAAQGTAAVGAVEEMVQFTSHSRWHLTVNAIDKFGLVITGASFQKSPGSPFIYVLFDGRLGEIEAGSKRLHARDPTRSRAADQSSSRYSVWPLIARYCMSLGWMLLSPVFVTSAAVHSSCVQCAASVSSSNAPCRSTT